MEKLKVAIIGCGAIHHVHAEAIINSEYAELTYVVDNNETLARESAKKHNCKYATDYKSLLVDDEIQVVNISTPHHLHCKMAIDAMKNGKYVFCEKPIAINTSDAKKMIETSIETNMKLGICFQNRYNNTTVKMKEIIDGKTLGDIKGIRSIVTWNRDKEYYTKSLWKGKYESEGGGVLINQAIHTIDLIQYLCGEVNNLKGNIDTRILKGVIEVEDTADATMVLSNNARWIFYATNGYTMDAPIDIQIHFENGMLQLMNNELFISKGETVKKIASDKVKNGNYKSYWGNSHSIAINEFYKSIIENKNQYIKSEDAVKSIKIIEAIIKSSKNKEWVNINY